MIEWSVVEEKRKQWPNYKQYTVGQTTDGKVYIQDDDFSYDARLYINGDFSNIDEAICYAAMIADRLNSN